AIAPGGQRGQGLARQVEPWVLLVHPRNGRDTQLAHERRPEPGAGQAIAAGIESRPQHGQVGLQRPDQREQLLGSRLGLVAVVAITAQSSSYDGGLGRQELLQPRTRPERPVADGGTNPGLLLAPHACEKLVGVVENPHGLPRSVVMSDESWVMSNFSHSS